MPTETYYTCPCCKRKGFMLQGLKAHRCDAKTKRRMTPTGPLERPRLTEKEIAKAVKDAITPKATVTRATHHTFRVRWQNGTHQAIDDRSWVKCSKTGGHEQAAYQLLDKQGITGLRLKLVRLHSREKGLADPKRAAHEQWQLYKLVGRCRGCGCTYDNCSECIDRTGKACHWIEDDLCSACDERQVIHAKA